MQGRGRYLASKVAWAVVTIFVVITFNFFLFRILPGDPSRSLIRDPRVNPEARAALIRRFGLDKPVFVNFEDGNPFDSQYFAYLGALSRGDLGQSFAQRDQSVADLLGQALGNTLLLIMPAQILSILIGIALGLLAAWRRGTSIDAGALIFSLFMWSLPTFFLGLLFLFAGSQWFDLPTAGRVTIGAHYASWWDGVYDIGKHLLLPTLSFTLVLLGEYMLIMRSSVIDVLSEDYILTAKAKGLTTWRIIRDHALKNSMLPMVTLIALNLGFTVSGAIQVESVFSYPGLGYRTVEAVSTRDFPVLQGAFLLLAISVVIANLAAELVYGWIDPRVTEG
ncbi:MAG TPA: ABC transporter permease [Candidatus Limnocylindria bacterium]|jgi:peptide/nickel transport system permease protein|nr:ABC transporter permease [Candidatus Limnocylindria bacterium]